MTFALSDFGITSTGGKRHEGPRLSTRLPKAKIRFIEPMYAGLGSEKLPEGKKWLYEVKFDGYRCLAGRDSKKVTLWSRKENHIYNHNSHRITRACERLTPDTLLDGEIVALDKTAGSHSIYCSIIAQRRALFSLRI